MVEVLKKILWQQKMMHVDSMSNHPTRLDTSHHLHLLAKKNVFNIVLQPILQIDNFHNIQDFLCKELLVKLIN
jgi:hypothetical protein